MQKNFNKFKRQGFKPGFNKFKTNRFAGKTKSNIVELSDGDYYQGTVKIMKKTLPGPVIFTVSVEP